ncbi:hypothetical protein [Bradyrhizobium sp. 164]|uniref:hypothetical protein n=1 Tax=Bradyrhizobium sp. 164 TaxID=2782637 RepID=UPI001FFB4EBD|nr:hypothetical protein [Bradyrhizobium sp. 164]MCK1595493.1 hypothetical protein [Bradyrhizobium sp. 164]
MSIRGPGRPMDEMIDGPDALIIVEYLSDTTGRSLASIINDAIRNRGYALDSKATTASHEKRIRRVINKLVKVQHASKRPSAKVLPFRRK